MAGRSLHHHGFIADFEDGRTAGLLWIAASGERVVGFALAVTIDGNRHLDELADSDVTPSLRQLASRETAAGLDVSPRIFMRRKP